MTLMRQNKQQKHGLQNGQQITSKNGIKGWKHCLEKCIDLDGDYVEK